MLYKYRLKARYHKSGEKSRHFSYPDYFTYPVYHDQPRGQRGPDNRGCTVSTLYLFSVSSLLSFGVESFPFSVSLLVAAAVLIDCGGAVALRGSLTLAGEDWVSASYFYKQILQI